MAGRRRVPITETTQENPPVEHHISLRYLVSREHKLYHLFNFIDQNYGNSPADIMKAISTILDFDKGLKSLKKVQESPIKSTFNLFRYALPAALYSVELIFKIKKYIEQINRFNMSEYDKMIQKIKEFLGIKPEGEIIRLETEFLNEEIIRWLLESPNTKEFKILGYYNNSYEVINTINLDSEKNIINILIEYNKNKIIINLTITRGFDYYHYESQYLLENNYTVTVGNIIKELELSIIKNYIHTLNIEKNILEYRGGITLKKRIKVNENINQFNVGPFIDEIKKVLAHGRKRGYGFIGLQGTGKSIILKKIEEIITDIIIIKLGPEEFLNPTSIKRCFKLIKMIQPAVVIIEDLCALGFKEKNERVGTFINEIDDINNDLNIILIVTINDTKQVHKTIIDRPGRFDEIIEIKPPQSCLEMYEVMLSKFNKLKYSYPKFKDIKFPLQKDINEILERCIKNKFTQAELTCGIIEKVFININDPKDSSIVSGIKDAVTSFEKSKKSLTTYSFNEKMEFIENDDMVEAPKDPIIMGTRKN
jgi:hypothetical protein